MHRGCGFWVAGRDSSLGFEGSDEAAQMVLVSLQHLNPTQCALMGEVVKNSC